MPFHVTCVCGQSLVVSDDHAGKAVRCTQCDRELAIPSIQAPAPPPVPVSAADDLEPVIVVNTQVEGRANLRTGRDRHSLHTIGWSLVLLALVQTVPVPIALLRADAAAGLIPLDRWALGLLMLAVLQGCYAIYLLQLPDASAARVVSFVTLGVATLYAVVAGMRLLASPGDRTMAFLELDANTFSTRQESLWCLAMILLVGTLSYLAGRAARS